MKTRREDPDQLFFDFFQEGEQPASTEEASAAVAVSVAAPRAESPRRRVGKAKEARTAGCEE